MEKLSLWCLSLRSYLPLNLNKLMLLLPWFMLLLEMTRNSMWRWLLVSRSMVQIESSSFCLKKTLNGLHQSPYAFWKYLTEKYGSCGISQAPFVTPASLLVKRSFQSAIFMISYHGKEMKKIILRCLSSCLLKELNKVKRMMLLNLLECTSNAIWRPNSLKWHRKAWSNKC